MSSEDQEMMARISQLAGQINRHKYQQANPGHTGQPAHRGHSYPYPRHYRVAKPTPSYRNRTLILNSGPASGSRSEADSGATSDSSATSWVTKKDRHLQLINANVYEKEAQTRSKAMEQTRQMKHKQQQDRERARLRQHLASLADAGARSTDQLSGPAKPYEVVVDGIRFIVTKNGSKLVKSKDAENAHKPTPKFASVGGVKFYRSKNGNLYRHGVVQAQRRSGVIKKSDAPCKQFSTNGSCPKGPSCRYTHDPEKVAICKDFMQRGECAYGDACDLSHNPTPERTPACLHFAKGNCTNPNCRYTHSTASLGAPVCHAFGVYGYCENGADCSDRHVFECPNFSNTGVCKTKGCKLLHRERASVLRKQQLRSAAENDEMADLSSDDDTVDSNDVDSDEVEEFFGDDDNDDAADLDITTQKEFISLN